jgi:hypothetical protein
MKSIYLNSFQIHSNSENLGFVVHTITGLEYPLLRPSHYDKPGESGAIVPNLLYGGRMITVTGTVFAETATLFLQRRRDLQNALSLIRDSYSVPVPITFKFTTFDDLALQVDCHLEDFAMKSENMNSQEFMIQFFAPNPELLSQNLATMPVLRGTPGGVIYPVIYPVIYAPSAGNTVTITNNGTLQSWPIVYLNGPLTNPIIQNDTLGRFIRLDVTLPALSQIVINMQSRTIIRDAATNIIGAKTDQSRFWWLEKGTNVIKLITNSNSDLGNAQVQYRDAYVGV